MRVAAAISCAAIVQEISTGLVSWNTGDAVAGECMRADAAVVAVSGCRGGRGGRSSNGGSGGGDVAVATMGRSGVVTPIPQPSLCNIEGGIVTKMTDLPCPATAAAIATA